MSGIKAIINNVKPIKEVKLWNAGYVQMYDFSEANSSEEHRVAYVTEIARVCRGDKPIANPTKLYKQLLTEHNGKPGEIFQFIPVIRTNYSPHVVRFGYTDDNNEILTNLRACLEDEIDYDYDKKVSGFYVFKIKVPLMIVPQILRHGQLSFNQQSERHCKLREYYYCDEFKPILDEAIEFFKEWWNFDLEDAEKHGYKEPTWNSFCYEASQSDLDNAQRRFNIPQELLNKGSHGLAYTTLWIAGWKQDPSQWDNFFSVRTKKPTQAELITVAKTMQQMMEE